MKRLYLFVVLVLSGCAAFWFVTQPRIGSVPVASSTDVAAGHRIFDAAGCAGCHSAPESQSEDRLVLAGGQRFPSPFGTFVAPNVSMDPTAGIGAWTLADFATALRDGVSPDGSHYYPAFPYTSYAYMTDQDVADLWAFWQTLPTSPTPTATHDVPIYAAWRRPIGLWKALFHPSLWADWDAMSDTEARGHYIVQALGHCAECHTPRNILGGLQSDHWMAGAPSADGKGRVPPITPATLQWSAADIVGYLKTGFTPDYDVAGGHMAQVIENISRLPDADLDAIAAYLVGIK